MRLLYFVGHRYRQAILSDGKRGQPEGDGIVATRRIEMELPEDLVALLGSPEVVAIRAKEALVLELLREARVSQGQAADLLGITRWALLDLMARHQIASGPETAEEMRREIEAMRRFAQGA